MMKRYVVYVPIAGYICKGVDARDKDAALDKVFESGYKDEDIHELDMYHSIIEGNVCHLSVDRAHAEEIKDKRKCRICGCTHYTPCEGGCYWVEDDLCSRCAGAEGGK